jgi:hypothetical protein
MPELPRQSSAERVVRLLDGPFAGAEVPKRGATIITEGPGVPDDYVARYRWSSGAGAAMTRLQRQSTVGRVRQSLTPARRRGFEVLVDQQNRGRLARESNVTSADLGAVYWQTAQWLVARDLARFPSGSTWLALTDRGVAFADELGLLGVPDA